MARRSIMVEASHHQPSLARTPCITEGELYFDPAARARGSWLNNIYAGGIARFSALGAVDRLVTWAREFSTARWPSPTTLHMSASREAVGKSIAEAQRAFARDSEAERLWRDVLEEAGLDPRDTYRDRLVLRIQPPIGHGDEEVALAHVAPLPVHRDTWASNIYAQVNWWAPVYTLDPARTMAIYPALWAEPIVNNSRSFNMERVREHIRGAAQDLRVTDLLPIATEVVERGGAVPVLIAPGEIVAFSAQHAHASIPNRTAQTRISLETRTVSGRDLKSGAGAPNVDGAAVGVIYDLFRRVSDRAPLSASML